MAFNGSGTFSRLYNWVTDRNAGVKIRADKMDEEQDGFATGLSNCITRDGQSTVTSDITLSGNKLTNVGTPTATTDAATKSYVDGVGTASQSAQTVTAATTANITIATALNNGDTLDGVTLATDDIVLVKDQTATEENGIYVVGTTPARAARYDTYDEHPGTLVTVQEGTVNADTAWICTSNVGGTLETTAIAWSNAIMPTTTRGDLVTRDATEQVRLPVGTANQILQTDGTDVVWATRDADTTTPGLIEIANQAQLETGTSTTLAVTPGRQFYHPAHPKAWMNYNQASPSLDEDFGVTSVADDNTGDFTVTLDTAFSNTTYASPTAVGRAGGVSGCSMNTATNTTTTRAFATETNNGTDSDAINHIIFVGDQ